MSPYRNGPLAGVVTCEDCGGLVSDQRVHDRFHSILSSHGWALAVLKTAHLAEHVHDRWEVGQKIDSKRFDNWSADAFAEVTGLPASPGTATTEGRSADG